MSARKTEIHTQLNQLLDALVLGFLLWGCYQLRVSGFVIFDSLSEIPPFPYFYWVLVLVMPFGPFFLEMEGFYTLPMEKTVARSMGQVFRAGIWLILLVGLAAFFFRLTVPSRSVLILFLVAAPLYLIVKERVLLALYYHQLERGALGEQILVVGEPERIAEFKREMTPTHRLELQIAEEVDLMNGEISDLVDALHRHAASRVILTFSKMELLKVQKAVEACEVEGVEAWLNADMIHTSVARPRYEVFGKRPMLVFRATPDVSWALLAKNLLDRVGALVLLVVLSPLLILVTISQFIALRGSVIFRQRRAGLHGKPFTMFKFRTMCLDAEEKRQGLEERNEMSGPVFKIKDDPRVTPLGRFLRKTSIDELPQLVNVLRGEMSLVGPRPLPLYEVEKFESAGHRRRLSMKPGLTCLWQVKGRNQVTDFKEWVALDLEYIDKWSFPLDLVILARTIPVVLFGRGAK